MDSICTVIVIFLVMDFRCIFTNINPETGERHPKQEPLQTLIKTRTILPDNNPPVMGVQMGLRIAGKISIGDAVYINVDY